MSDYLVITIGDEDTIQRLDFEDVIEKVESKKWNLNDIKGKYPEHTALENWDAGIYILDDSFNIVVPKPSGWEIE